MSLCFMDNSCFTFYWIVDHYNWLQMKHNYFIDFCFRFALFLISIFVLQSSQMKAPTCPDFSVHWQQSSRTLLCFVYNHPPFFSGFHKKYLKFQKNYWVLENLFLSATKKSILSSHQVLFFFNYVLYCYY